MDAAFLAMERPGEPRHLGSVCIFGPGADGPLTYETVRSVLEERLPLIASARRVVVEVPLGLGRPTWGSDKRFDLEFHLRRTAVPASGGPSALADLIARAHARPLDRSRPLWELWFIDGLPDGRVALYTKMHMAAIDDVTGAEVMTALLSVQAGEPSMNGHRDRAERPLDRLLGGLPDQFRQASGFPGRMATRAVRALGHQAAGLGETVVESIHRTPGLDSIARLLPPPTIGNLVGEVLDEHTTGRAPRVSWNAPVTAHRSFAMTQLPLDAIVAIKRATDTTVNDVVVAVCAGALRHWLDEHRELPTSPLVAMVPMLVRGGRDGRDDAHVAGLVVQLPTNVADPGLRLRRTSEALQAAKQRRVAVPASMMQDVSMFAPPALAALAGRLVGALPHRAFASPTVNLAITNVPGPREQVYLAGRPLEANYPVLTINELSPLHIGLQSSHGAIGVGALSCRDTLGDLAPLVERMSIELHELHVSVAATGTKVPGKGRRR
ncbi:MAG: wax ester/triacylglycerol synthase family O-acyltransferase [Ilumatobacteraceae bacterium]